MRTTATGPLAEVIDRFTEYLPTLTAGLLVLAVGFVVGWLAKRAVVRVLIWLRLDRLGGRYAWRAAFGKGDVRAALYNIVGSTAMVLVVLVFLDNALQIWGLLVLSRSIDAIIVYLPTLALVAVIVGLGLLLANAVAHAVERSLEEEGAPRPRLIAMMVKAGLLSVVGALALWELQFARQVVLAGFLILFGAIGVTFALAVGLGSAKAVQRGWESMFKKEE